MSMQIHYPLLFSYKDNVAGNGFLASVKVTGKALIHKEEEDGLWWMSGVQPGGLIEKGVTPNEAFLSFRQRYGLILFDIAEESWSFEHFKSNVEDFFSQVSESEEKSWDEAHALIKSGAVIPEEPFAGLKKETPKSCPVSITVLRLDQTGDYQPSDNMPDMVILPTQKAA